LLERLSTVLCAAQDINPFGKGDKFRQGSDLHFLHDPMAMGLDGTFGAT
jgi:hypothetical protein